MIQTYEKEYVDGLIDIAKQYVAQEKQLELAWGLIANAYGSDWTLATDEWRVAAQRWRDQYRIQSLIMLQNQDD